MYLQSATLLRPKRLSYAFCCAFVSFLYKYEFQLIYVQLISRDAQVAMLQLTFMNHRLITVNSEIFARILISRITLKDTFATLKIRDFRMIYLHQ